MKRTGLLLVLVLAVFSLTGCGMDQIYMGQDQEEEYEVNSATALEDLIETDYFRDGALAHILEGELNNKGQAVGFHYANLPTRQGEIIEDTKSTKDKHGVYEAEVAVSEVEKTSNGGRSTFFPDSWDSQDVVDAINEAYDDRTFISGNTYEGLTAEGIVVRMYLDESEKIISAFPVY